jgi:hypothetical protein
METAPLLLRNQLMPHIKVGGRLMLIRWTIQSVVAHQGLTDQEFRYPYLFIQSLFPKPSDYGNSSVIYFC